MNRQIEKAMWVDSSFKSAFVSPYIIAMIIFILFLSSGSLLRAQNYGDVVAEDEIFVQYAIGVVIDKRNDLLLPMGASG